MAKLSPKSNMFTNENGILENGNDDVIRKTWLNVWSKLESHLPADCKEEKRHEQALCEANRFAREPRV